MKTSALTTEDTKRFSEISGSQKGVMCDFANSDCKDTDVRRDLIQESLGAAVPVSKHTRRLGRPVNRNERQ